MTTRFSQLPWHMNTAGERTPNLDIPIRTDVTVSKKIKVEKVVFRNTSAAGVEQAQLLEGDGATVILEVEIPAATAGGGDGVVERFFNEAWIDGFEVGVMGANSRVEIYLASPDVSPSSFKR